MFKLTLQVGKNIKITIQASAAIILLLLQLLA